LLRTQNPGATAPGRCDDQSNSESPAYSHGGHESAGFSGYGIQQATRLQRATSIIAVGIIAVPAAVSSGLCKKNLYFFGGVRARFRHPRSVLSGATGVTNGALRRPWN